MGLGSVRKRDCVWVASTLRLPSRDAYSQTFLVSFPDPSLAPRERGSVTNVGILGCADSAVVGKLRNKT